MARFVNFFFVTFDVSFGRQVLHTYPLLPRDKPNVKFASELTRITHCVSYTLSACCPREVTKNSLAMNWQRKRLWSLDMQKPQQSNFTSKSGFVRTETTLVVACAAVRGVGTSVL